MCGLFSPPEMPEPILPPLEEEPEGRETLNLDRERRRAAARQGFESTWLTRNRVGSPGGGGSGQGTASGGAQAPRRPQTVMRRTLGS
jgi:hypothetical protein